MDRAYLIETLENLLSDEYSAADFVKLSDEALVEKIIDAAYYYQEKFNDLED